MVGPWMSFGSWGATIPSSVPRLQGSETLACMLHEKDLELKASEVNTRRNDAQYSMIEKVNYPWI